MSLEPKAAGHVMLAALRESGLDLDAMRRRILQPINPPSALSGSIAREGKPEGPYASEVIVFTGALEMPRREAAALAEAVGCTVASAVNKKTTLLVVGDMDVARLGGHEKSSKHRKAEELLSAGQPLRIIRETDFRELLALE